jgi:predicted DNA-binding transcriptional regulator YafY
MDKNQYERYKQIDRILRSVPDGLPLDTLLERLNGSLSFENQIKRRQLQYDLDALKDLYGAPIDNKRGARRIKYEDASYSIITHEMKESLKSMSEQLDNIQMNPRLLWLQNLILMLQDTYFTNEMAMEAIDFGDNLEYENSSRVHEFFSYILNKQVLELNYNAGFGKPQKRIIHPYFVRQYNNRWFLFGYCEQAAREGKPVSGILNLPLDRIVGVKTVPTIYRELTVQDIKDFKEDYFGDIVGVTRLDSERPIHLVMRFDFSTGDSKQDNAARRDYFYLRTKPFYPYINFPSEKEIEKTGCAEVSMDIIPNKELEGILLRYADSAKILGDEPFRNKMLDRIRNIVEKQGK